MPPDFEPALRVTGKGVVLSLEVSAGSKFNRFPAGYNEWRHSIGVQVTAPPVEGKANKAICNVVARVLGIPASRVSIVAGSTSSQKQVLVLGLDKTEILAALAREI
ncbi:uncharacterized protein (TIGR00251 family) [Methanolinea mesophila]|uniref:DUF167 domain-containing protein n=1 Tax=Methanolinea mesophila TaxID=547055 RepID=UPI001AE42217|nr:DUF167 domain-containing protein [Methanolinea mesophila]MBP1928044.1 uncharacterized protein (TIGR00251 family) [Methanolinea mesophila]